MPFITKIRPGEEWLVTHAAPFDDLILSWNIPRPARGHYRLAMRLFTTQWSAWLPYADWAADDQSTFDGACAHAGVRLLQDTASVLDGRKATRFHVRLEGREGASPRISAALFAATCDKGAFKVDPYDGVASLQLPVQGLSQMALQSPLSMRICSPASTSAVIAYLGGALPDPLGFAARVRDSRWDIYGNWALNVAQAHLELGGAWDCWAERLAGFAEIVDSLRRNVPVVVSVKGPLAGSIHPYNEGHLLVVTGYDAPTRTVACMDPAFPADGQTAVSYDLADFLSAWGRRFNLAYRFHLRDTP